MSNCQFLSAESIAQIIFEGDRYHARKNITKASVESKGVVSRLYNIIVDAILPEPEAKNLGTAKQYLTAIGYKSWQIKHFETVLNHAAEKYLNAILLDVEENGVKYREVPLLVHSDRFYLGVRIGDDRDYAKEMFPDFKHALRETFVEDLNALRRNKTLPGLLYTHYDQYPHKSAKDEHVLHRAP